MLAQVVAELQPLLGARLQRLDVVDEREIVWELRLPGQTLRLLASARAGVERVHMVSMRPERRVPHSPLQAFLRGRLVGQRIGLIEARYRSFILGLERDRVLLNLQGGKRALQVEPSPVPVAEWVKTQLSFPLSEALSQQYKTEAPKAQADQLRVRLSRSLSAQMKKFKRLEKNLLSDLDRLERYKALGHQGELLKTVFPKLRRGQAQAKVYDWLSQSEIEISLDPAKSPKDNLQSFFDRAKKADRGRPVVEARLEALWERMEALERKMASLRDASTEKLLDWLGSAEGGGDGFSTITSSAKRSAPIDKVARRFVSIDGAEIFVGRGAEANDQLSFRFSKGSDTWLHARGTAGAHVLVPASSERPPTDATLLDAAHLAAHYSSSKNESKAEVMVAEARYVKKTKGAPAGLVGVSKSRTIVVKMESGRIDRLFGRRP